MQMFICTMVHIFVDHPNWEVMVICYTQGTKFQRLLISNRHLTLLKGMINPQMERKRIDLSKNETVI